MFLLPWWPQPRDELALWGLEETPAGFGVGFTSWVYPIPAGNGRQERGGGGGGLVMTLTPDGFGTD